ncbi:BTAD domain-containing putative transcriptional regulator [Streptomyces morookaense]|uniref:AfsR/SARP family transcriptional regulator n=1 Tax=Streptomyces morookaense TaxID=1970 RepID=UPI0033F3A670
MDSHNGLRFHLLGPVRAEHHGHPLPVGSPVQRAVLAVLLLGGRPTTTRELAAALWGDTLPEGAGRTLRTCISRLRATLGEDVLRSENGAWSLRTGPEALDATVFAAHRAAAAAAREAGDLATARERLGAALALWEGGTALAGLPGPYAEQERARLDDLHAAAREDLLDCAIAAGEHAETVADLRALVADHPLRERPRALLMLALYRSGRQAEALAVFDAAPEPGPGLTRLRDRILAGDGTLSAPAPGTPAGAAPDGLPPDIRDFTGREELLARIKDASARGPVALTGPAGVGKTALAVHAAHALRHAHPDGLLHLDLRGTDPAPVDTATALAQLLHALGVDQQAVPESEEHRTALYRSLLHGRRTLVLLDDARDAEQLRPLLPDSPGCTVLITSSTPLDEGIPVPPLTGAEALHMLETIAGRPCPDAPALVESCAGLPLTVRIAAGLVPLPAGGADVLHAAYDALDPEQARAFRLLALADAPSFDTATAAAVLDTDARAAAALTNSLAEAGLLQPVAPDRHRHHDLLKSFARLQSEHTDSPPVRDAALLRLLDHHLATAANALLHHRPDSPVPRHVRRPSVAGQPLHDKAAAAGWLRDAHPHLLATVDQVLRLDVPGGIRAATDLLTTWGQLLTGTGLHADLEPPARQALDRARKDGDDISAARALRLLGAPRLGPDTYGRAEAELRDSVRLAEPDPLTLALASHEHGAVLLAMGRPEEALPLLTRAEEAFRAEGSPTHAAEALADRAGALSALGRTDEAVEAVGRATEEARALGHVPTLVHALTESGRTLLRAGRTATATDRLREALTLPLPPREEALLWARLAHCRLDQHLNRDAVTDAERALTLEAGTGATYCRALALWARGRALLALGEPRPAQGHLREAHELLERRGAAEAGALRALLDEEFGAP